MFYVMKSCLLQSWFPCKPPWTLKLQSQAQSTAYFACTYITVISFFDRTSLCV